MPRARSPKRDEAYKIWLDSNGKKKLKDIASDLGVSETQIRKWKNQDKWNSNVTNQSNGNVTKRKRGGQPGNHNATGPPGNKNGKRCEAWDQPRAEGIDISADEHIAQAGQGGQ